MSKDTQNLNIPVSQVAWWADDNQDPQSLSVDLHGNLNTNIWDSAGRKTVSWIFWEQRATDVVNNILMQFWYWLSPKDVDIAGKTEVNWWTISLTWGNLLTASAWINIAWEASIVSTNEVRYRPWHTTIVQFTPIFENYWNIDSEVWAWWYDDQNGFRIWFEDWVMKFQIIKSGAVVHSVSWPNFNGDIILANYDFSMMNNFRLIYWYLGIAPISLEIMQTWTSKYVTVHTFRLQNTQAETHIDIPYLPFKIEAKNTGNNTDISVKIWSVQGWVFGLCQTCWTRFFSFEWGTTSSALLASWSTFVNFKSVTTFQTKHNHIVAELIRMNAVTDTSDVVRIRFFKNAVLTWTPAWNDVDPVSSTVQYDNWLSYDSGWEVAYTDYIVWGKSVWVTAWSTWVSLWDEWLTLQAWDVMTLQVDKLFWGTSAFDMNISFNWQELF